MASGMFFQFDASTHAAVNLLGLGTILVLPWHASVEVVKGRCQNYSSKAWLSFGANEPRSLQERQLPKNCIQLWDSWLPAAIV